MHTLQRVLQQSAILSLILHTAGSAGVNLSGVPAPALVAVFKEGGTKTLVGILKDLAIQEGARS